MRYGQYKSDADLQAAHAAYQVYYESLPLRRSSLPDGPDMQLYRRLAFGRLAEFNVLDARQYRDDQACGDGLQVPCDEARDPARTFLGTEQEQRLIDGLGASTTTWNVIAQQCVMARADRDPGPGELLATTGSCRTCRVRAPRSRPWPVSS